ncbi:acyII [Acrasis kona]|uniref:AcyII n=1 Tax=Acrasis kona TaxID=1008807 RepID=A0AAW2YHZ8_9EUKA
MSQDRLWQMEVIRRVATGTMSELVGSEAIPVDKITRTFGFHRLGRKDVEALIKKDPKTGKNESNFVGSFVDGVNAYLKSPDFKAPVEFTILKVPIKPWSEDEVGAVMRLLGWQMSRGWHYKIVNQALKQSLKSLKGLSYNSEQVIQAIFDLTDNDSATTLPTGVMEINWDKLDDMIKHQPASEQGSNCWVVGGKYTGGAAMLASDPHLSQTLPNVWYQNHIVVQNDQGTHLDVTGATITGIPFVQIGHNQNVAWGITLSYADVADIFIEEVDSEQNTYTFKNKQLPLTVFDEHILVKNQSSIHHKVLVSHHGPILQGLMNYSGSTNFAIQATFLQEDLHVPVDVFFRMNQAKSARELREQAVQLSIISLNVVFGDDQGNIGYQMTGEVPKRSQHAIKNANLPHLGWDGLSDWEGYHDLEENPATFNPKQGYIISANHKIVGPDYKNYLGSSFKYGGRAIRIKQLLLDVIENQKRNLTLQDFANIQNDVTEPTQHWIHLINHIKDNLSEIQSKVPIVQNITHDHVLMCFNLLVDYNGDCNKNSIQAGIYNVYVDQLFKTIMTKHGIDEEMTLRVKGCGLHPALFSVNEYFGHEVHTITKLSKIKHLISADDMYQSMIQTIYSLRQLLNLKQAPQDPHEVLLNTGLLNHLTRRDANITAEQEIELYKYGNYHTLHFQHAFGKLVKEFNRGPYPAGGTATTPNMGAPYPDGKQYTIQINPSYRMLVDLSKINNAQSILAPGNSGHLASEHYDDYIYKYINGEYNQMYYAKEDVEKYKEHTLILKK